MLNPNDIDTEKSVWEMIADALIRNGIKVYPPAMKMGGCDEEYVVLKQAGSVQVEAYSSVWDYYMFMLYVPKEKYTDLDRLERKVTKVIRDELYPMIKPTGLKENDSFDDNINAHIRMFTYRNSRREPMI